MKEYSEYKPSGVEWIGDIPQDWSIIPIKRVFKNTKTIAGNNVDKYERLALTMNGVIKRSKEDAKGLQPTQFEGYQILKENELVFKLIDLENVKTSRVGLSSYTGIVSPAYIVLSNRMTDNRFYYYYFMFMYYNKIFNNLGGEGVRSALNGKDLLNMPIVLISEEKQKKIADFLDYKMSKIDALIADKEKLIELLKEQRRSIISETVTKGLDKKAEMKPSGIKWISMIPKNFKIKKMKYIAQLDKENLTEKTNPNYKFEYIDIGSVSNGKIDKTTDMIFKESPSSARRIVKKGDIIVSRVRTYLRAIAYIENHDKCICSTGFCVLTPNYIDSKYLYFYCMSEFFIQEISKNSVGICYPTINSYDIGRMQILIPPLEKQKEIANFLDDKTKKIDTLISGKEKLIELLKEQRRSIISETVTKGLDKKAEMKPSGVEWIGDIPVDWEIKKLKYIAELYPKYRISGIANDMDVTFSPMECVKAGILEQRLSKFSNYSSSYNIFKNGDILMAKVTPCFENGNIVIAKDLRNGIGFGSSELFIIRCFGVNTEYMFYYFQNNTFMEMAKSTMYGVAGLKRVSADFVKNSQTLLPARKEQKKIVSYLNEKVSQIDNLIENLTKQIKKLQEYRKSIVSEAVTGKAAI
jgi:restriction endonuclease S subunit